MAFKGVKAKLASIGKTPEAASAKDHHWEATLAEWGGLYTHTETQIDNKEVRSLLATVICSRPCVRIE